MADQISLNTKGSRAKVRGLRSNFLGAGAVYALASVAPVLSTLLVTPFVTRVLGPGEYGFAGIAITLYQVGAVIFTLGLPFAITRHAIIARSGIRGASALVLAGSVVTLVLAGLSAASLAYLGHSSILRSSVLDFERTNMFMWPILSSAGLALLALGQSFLRALNRVYLFVVLSFVSAVLSPLLGLASVQINGPYAASYLAGIAVGHIFAGAIAVVAVRVISRPSFSWPELRKSIQIGMPTLPHSVAIMFLVSALVLASSVVNGVENAGRLQLALLLGTAPSIILGAFNNAWAPMIYKATDANRPRILSSSFRGISVLVLVLVSGFCVLARPVVSFIAGPQLFNEELLTAAIAVTASTPFMALYLVNIHLTFLSGKTTPLAFTTPVSLALALSFVATASFMGLGGELFVYAAAVSVFQLAQWGASSILVRFSGFPAPSIVKSLPVLGTALAITLSAAIWSPPNAVAIPIVISITVIAVLANRSVFRLGLDE